MLRNDSLARGVVPLPAPLMRRIGSRLTLFAAGLTLASGFGLAYSAQNLWVFYAAMALLGIGFTLALLGACSGMPKG